MTAPEHRQSASALAAGEVVAGRYRVIDAMGEGGMATVHRAEDLRTGRRVALKVLRPELSKSPEAVERLRREAQVLARLRHPAIVQAGEPGWLPSGQLYLVMELLEGETLGARLRRGRLDVAELAPIVSGICAGLEAAHAQGVVHRDLKPDNVFLTRAPFGGAEGVKLLDFGISKVLGFDRLTRTGQVLGTPRYMAPEQLLAELGLDARVDVYALGVILYEALSGQPAFPATTPSALIVSILGGKAAPLRSLRRELPVELEALVARAMARAPEARFSSAAEVAAAFVELSQWAGPPAARAGAPAARAGMSTTALGTMDTNLAPRPVAPASDDIRPGTFSEFEVPAQLLDSAARAMSPVAAEAPVAAGGPVAAAAPVGSGAPVGSDAARPAPAPGAAGPRASRRRVAVASALCLLVLLLVGAGAGAVKLYGDARAPAPPPRFAPPARPPAEHSEVLAGALAPAETPAPEPTETPGPAPAEPAAPPAPEPAALVPSEPPELDVVVRRAPARRRPNAEADAPAVPPPLVYEAPAADSPRGLLAAARAARDEGDISACISAARRASSAGAGPAADLVLGDCYFRGADYANAAKAYERFCNAAPEHASVARVSELVARYGGACP